MHLPAMLFASHAIYQGHMKHTVPNELCKMKPIKPPKTINDG